MGDNGNSLLYVAAGTLPVIIYFVNLETLDVLSQKHEPESLLAFLKETEDFAVTFNDLRYYHFSLNSGFKTCNDEAS